MLSLVGMCHSIMELYQAIGETYDVPIKMDTIEGDTLFVLDTDLILDTEIPYFKFKNTIDDFISNFKNNIGKYKIYPLYPLIQTT